MSVEGVLREAFRLTAYEARAYLALVRRGEMSAKEVAAGSKVPLPRIYDTLKSLGDKGFVEQVEDRYSAVPPETALRGRITQFRLDFEKGQEIREEAAKKAAAELGKLQSRSGAPRDVVLIRGIYGIANRFIEILKESQDLFLVVRKAIKVKNLFTAGMEDIAVKGKRIRLLLPEGIRLSKEDRALASKLGVEMRLLSSALVDVMVADNRDVMIGVPDPLSDEPFQAVAVWLRNPSFAKSIRESLEEIWKKAPVS